MTGPEKRRLVLGDQLKELRQGSGLSGKQLAQQAGWPASKVSRIENARQAVSDADIRTWCKVTNATEALADALRDELRSLRLDEARTRRDVRRSREQPAADQRDSRDIEQTASVIRIFELAAVPTLVQTAEYARHILATTAARTGTADSATVDSATVVGIQAWMERQQVLYAPGRQIEITLTESALRYPVCPPEVLCAQIDRLLALQGLPGMRLGVIPLGTRLPVLPLHGFWILDDVVVIRTFTGELLIRDSDESAVYQRLIDGLASVAEQGDAARTLLTRLIGEWSGS